MEKSADQVNSAVARIAGISRKLFEDTRDKREVSEEEKVNQGVYGLDLPKEHEMPPKKAKGNVDDSPDYDDEEDEVEGVHPGKGGKMEAVSPEVKKQRRAMQGDEAKRRELNAFGTAAGDDPLKTRARSYKHAKQVGPHWADPKSMAYNPAEYDRTRGQQTSRPNLPESKENYMSEAFKTATGCPLNEWKRLAGLDEDQTGQVPTSGVSKQNKMKAGLPGLEGDSVQAIGPTEGPEGEGYVGDDKEVTFDDAIAMLKKEGVDVDAMWVDFLETRGISPELFNQMIDEAMQGEDTEEMDALLAVEGIFHQELPHLLPEGVLSRVRSFFGGRGAEDDEPASRTSPVALAPQEKWDAARAERDADPEAARALATRGIAPTSPKAHPAIARMRTVRPGQAPAADLPLSPWDLKQRKLRAAAGRDQGTEDTDEAWAFEADDDGTGEPVMPWMNQAAESVMGRLAGKYMAEAKAKLEAVSRAKKTARLGQTMSRVGMGIGPDELYGMPGSDGKRPPVEVVKNLMRAGRWQRGRDKIGSGFRDAKAKKQAQANADRFRGERGKGE